jgi:hypothetical protein
VTLNALDDPTLNVSEYSLINTGNFYATYFIKDPCPASEYTEGQQYLLMSARILGAIDTFKRNELSEEVTDLLPYFERGVPSDGAVWNLISGGVILEDCNLTLRHAQIITGAYWLASNSDRNRELPYFQTKRYMSSKLKNSLGQFSNF